MQKYIAIIPARLQSTRLPRKPLADLSGKTMLERVFLAVNSAKLLSNVIIATDSYEIAKLCKEINANFVITDPELPSGTDRIYQAYKHFNEKADVIINIQGDEPFITAQLIDDFILFLENQKFDVGTIIKRISNNEEIENPSVVKVVINPLNYALYFSRSAIPFLRDIPKEQWLSNAVFYKHIGIYAYQEQSLSQFVNLGISYLEKNEKLEQLRLLENGSKYLCFETTQDLFSIDTYEDLEKARKLFARQ